MRASFVIAVVVGCSTHGSEMSAVAPVEATTKSERAGSALGPLPSTNARVRMPAPPVDFIRELRMPDTVCHPPADCTFMRSL